MIITKKIKVGSRDSVLAIKQAQIVIDAAKEKNPEIEFEIIRIKTAGDRILDLSLDDLGGKGVFIKELEQALADGDIDIAVHSYKDMPYEETAGLPIVALSDREEAFDVMVLPEGVAGQENQERQVAWRVPDRSKPVGSSSRRRAIQFYRLYP